MRICGWRAIFTVIFSLLLASVLTGCGSPSSAQQAAATPPPPVLPAIAAAKPVLLFNGTGTTDGDVAAVETILGNLNLGYITADSAQLDSLSEQQLAGYKLIIIPGGNSITIGQNLSAATSSNIRGAVQAYGTHYLGLCAGAFFEAIPSTTGLTSPVESLLIFNAAENQGIHTEPVLISFPSGAPLDVYWQDGPQLSGHGVR